MNSDNLLIRLIIEGKIKNERELKKSWRLLAIGTHPDLTESSSDEFLRLTDWYDEARDYLRDLEKNSPEIDRKREFYLCLKELEDLELAYNKTQKNQRSRYKLENELPSNLIKWLGGENDSYLRGLEEYIRLKNESRPNDQEHIYRPGFYDLMKPLLYNLTSFQLTGKSLYLRQFNKHLKTVEEDMDALKYPNLIRLLHRLTPKNP